MRTIRIQMSALLCVLMMMASCSSDEDGCPGHFYSPIEEESDLTDMRNVYADGTEWWEDGVRPLTDISVSGGTRVYDIHFSLKEELSDKGEKRLRIYRENSIRTSMLLYVGEKEITGEIESTHERKKLYDFSSGLVHGEKFSFSLFELKDWDVIGFKDFDVTIQDVELTSHYVPYPYYPWLQADGCFRLKGFSTLEGSDIYSFGGQFIGKGGLFCYDSDVNWTEKKSRVVDFYFPGPDGTRHHIHDIFGEQSY